MIATSFKEENCIYHPPKGMTPEECSVLPTLRGIVNDEMPVIVSCWKVTKEELDEIIKTGRIWLTVCNTEMPPVALDGIKPDYVQ